MNRKYQKLIYDFIINIIFILIASWVIIIIFFLILIIDRQWPIFCQTRIGKNEKPFVIYKFKTMKNNTPTKFGAWLRKFKADELLQLFNVLKGNMSLVGPRPLIKEEYKDYGLYRLTIKPGITGLSQLSKAISIRDKQYLDEWYVDHYSFLLDLKIIGLTFGMKWFY